jgi:hypothetical protein
MGVNMEGVEDKRLLKAAIQERHLREEMLGKVKGGVKSFVRLRTGPKDLNLLITGDEKGINPLTNFAFSHPDIQSLHNSCRPPILQRL